MSSLFSLIDPVTLAMVLSALAVGGLILVLVPLGDRAGPGTRRISRVTGKVDAEGARRLQQLANEKRRRKVQDALKEVDRSREAQRRAKTLAVQLQQAGLSISPRDFYIRSVLCGAFCAGVFGFFVSSNPMLIAGTGVAGALGLPRMWLKRMAKKYKERFLTEFPVAIEAMARGVKTGLSIGECLTIVAQETEEPVKSEFQEIMEVQRVGLTLEEAISRLNDKVQLSEVNFLRIVIGLQQKAGGQLSEVLANLGFVLRERRKMGAKIEAYASEGKTSANVIAALPFFIGGIIYFMRPDLMESLFTRTSGQLLMGGCLLWMGVGMFVMRKMVNFDY